VIDTRNKRAAAIGFGLSFLLVLPGAEGVLSVESAGHALSAYRYDLDVDVEVPDGAILMIPAAAPVIEIDDPDTMLFPDRARIVLIPQRRRP
jgi:hypothetical protein